MAFIGGTPLPPKRTFTAPGHVNALGILAFVTIVAGLVCTIFSDTVIGLFGLLQGVCLIIAYSIAEDAAYTRWKLDLLVADMQSVIDESAAQGVERILARQKREIEEAAIAAEKRRLARETRKDDDEP